MTNVFAAEETTGKQIENQAPVQCGLFHFVSVVPVRKGRDGEMTQNYHSMNRMIEEVIFSRAAGNFKTRCYMM